MQAFFFLRPVLVRRLIERSSQRMQPARPITVSSSTALGSPYGATGATNIGDPVQGTTAHVDRTSDYTGVSNSSKWVKTHYSHLSGKTIGTSYTRGDNIHYQGKNYVYVSHLDSNDALYTDPSNEGYTEFSDLLRLGASYGNFRCSSTR